MRIKPSQTKVSHINFNISSTLWSILYSRQSSVSEDIPLRYQVLWPIIKHKTFYQPSKGKDKVIFLNVMKVYGGAKVYRHSFLTSKLEVGSQLHALTAVPPVKESSVSTEVETRWAPKQVWVFWRRGNIY